MQTPAFHSISPSSCDHVTGATGSSAQLPFTGPGSFGSGLGDGGCVERGDEYLRRQGGLGVGGLSRPAAELLVGLCGASMSSSIIAAVVILERCPRPAESNTRRCNAACSVDCKRCTLESDLRLYYSVS